MVMLESVVSGHRINIIRPRLSEKAELIRYDPRSKSSILLNIITCKPNHFYINGMSVM